MSANTPLPILYSFRRCPYAMRARLAIAVSEYAVELREVVLRDKPQELIDASEKATVPVLIVGERVIEESRDIMRFVLGESDPLGWIHADDNDWLWEAEGLIQENDFVFKQHLDRYKYADRYPDHTMEYYREQCEVTLAKLDKQLQRNNGFLVCDRMTIADAAIFPFIRQCAHVDRNWFYQTDYLALQQWLDKLINSELFASIMSKYPKWQSGYPGINFPEPQ